MWWKLVSERRVFTGVAKGLESPGSTEVIPMASIAQLPDLPGMDLLRFGGQSGGGFVLMLLVLVVVLLVAWALARPDASARN